MSPAPKPIADPAQLISLLRRYPRRWLVPAAAIAVLAAMYAFLWPSTWEATQALIIRDEAANNDQQLGKFSRADEMKTVQETILELVRSRRVLGAALREVGPPAASRKAHPAWPSDRDVENFRDRVKLVPPKGAEFGKTEVFYLKVRAKDRRRAKALVAAVAGQLEIRFQQLRDTTAQSMIDELLKAVKVARDDLTEATARLSRTEKEVGSDLAELRVLVDSASGESALRRTATEIRNELRQARIARKGNEELLAVLQDAQKDPNCLAATPGSLLEAQPALKRLREGLVDAQLRTAQLEGRMAPEHPLVQASREAEQQILNNLHNELATAIGTIEVDLRMNADRVGMLEGQLAEVTGKLGRLAGLRAEYSNLLAEVQTRTELLERAEQGLTEARVSHATAGAASLIGRIDAPAAGTDPVGPGPAIILLAGLAGGLVVGFGLLLLSVPAEAIALRQPTPLGRAAAGPTELGGVTPVAAIGTALTFKEALEKISSPSAWN